VRPDYAIVISCNQARLEQFLAQWHTLPEPRPPLEIYSVERDHENPIRGCWQSHLDVLGRVVVEPLAVFEDDAVFGPGFTWDTDVPDDWDMLYWGGASLERDETDSPLVSVREIMDTQSYVVRHPNQVAELLGPPVVVEPYIETIHVDRALGRDLPLVRYCVNPPTVGQRGGVPSAILSGFVRREDEFFVNQYARNNARLGRPQDEDLVRDLSRELARRDQRVFQFLSEDLKNEYRARAREELNANR
jgi:hypothetical protein